MSDGADQMQDLLLERDRRFRAAFVISLVFLFCCNLQPTARAGGWVWPTDASRALSSSFGEYRPGHFHAGVDIKTWGRTGYQVFAVSSGYIWKVRVSPFGYGKVVYQVTDTGEIAVYAHLSRFAEPIESRVRAEQRRTLRYSVSLEFRPNEIRVRRGQVIAYTGDTGVGYPHLHFELRDSRNRPTNPMLHGFGVEDHIAPIPAEVALVPLAWWSRVSGDVAPQVYPVFRLDNTTYAIADTVLVWGPFYVAVNVSDRTDGARNRIAPYGLRLYADGRLLFSSRYDRFSYAQTRLIVLDRDFRLQVRTGRTFYRLFVDPENSLLFYGPFGAGAGVLWAGTRIYPERRTVGAIWLDGLLEASELDRGFHQLRIEAFDFAGNTCTVLLPIQVGPPAEYPVSTVLETNETGAGDGGEEPALRVDWYEDFARLDLVSPTGDRPLAMAICAGDTFRLAVESLGLERWMAIWPFPNLSYLEGEFVAQVGGTMLRRPFRLVRVAGDRGTVSLQEAGIRVDIPADVGFRPFYIEVRDDFAAAAGLLPQPCGPVVRIEPEDVPLRSAIKLRWRIDSLPNHHRQKVGWYYASPNGWKFVGNDLTADNVEVRARISGLGIFGVVLDTIPPVLVFRSPSRSQPTVSPGTDLVITMFDELSGIKGEEDFGVELDGQRIVVEWDPEEKVLRYSPQKELTTGPHVVRVWAVDRSGNRSEESLRFFVE